jgi:hypothetical protein
MTKNILIIFSFVCLTLTSSYGAVYKGQKYFVKTCVKCHDSGQAFVAEYKMKQWKKWMNKKGKALADLHLKNEKAEESHKYFEGKAYPKQSKHLKQFLVEYAKDSGNVPACN